jgi:ParB-like nuclease domain
MSRIDHRQRKISKAPAAAACGASDGSNLRLPRHAPQFEAMQPMAIEPMPVASLRPYRGNARTHSKKQVRQIADSIGEFGFNKPVLIGEDGEIIAGHGRVEAAKLLGLDCVPTVRLAHLNAAQRRAYVLADNQLALKGGWDRELLAIELQGLIDIEFDVELTGFSATERIKSRWTRSGHGAIRSMISSKLRRMCDITIATFPKPISRTRCSGNGS